MNTKRLIMFFWLCGFIVMTHTGCSGCAPHASLPENFNSNGQFTETITQETDEYTATLVLDGRIMLRSVNSDVSGMIIGTGTGTTTFKDAAKPPQEWTAKLSGDLKGISKDDIFDVVIDGKITPNKNVPKIVVEEMPLFKRGRFEKILKLQEGAGKELRGTIITSDDFTGGIIVRDGEWKLTLDQPVAGRIDIAAEDAVETSLFGTASSESIPLIEAIKAQPPIDGQETGGVYVPEEEPADDMPAADTLDGLVQCYSLDVRPADVKKGDEVTIDAIFMNRGPGTSPPATGSIYIDHYGFYKKAVPSLRENEKYTYRVKHRLTQTGLHTVSSYLKNAGVAEPSKCFTEKLSVAGTEDFAIGEIGLQQWLYPGHNTPTVKASARVKLTSRVPYKLITVWLKVVSDTGYETTIATKVLHQRTEPGAVIELGGEQRLGPGTYMFFVHISASDINSSFSTIKGEEYQIVLIEHKPFYGSGPVLIQDGVAQIPVKPQEESTGTEEEELVEEPGPDDKKSIVIGGVTYEYSDAALKKFGSYKAGVFKHSDGAFDFTRGYSENLLKYAGKYYCPVRFDDSVLWIDQKGNILRNEEIIRALTGWVLNMGKSTEKSIIQIEGEFVSHINYEEKNYKKFVELLKDTALVAFTKGVYDVFTGGYTGLIGPIDMILKMGQIRGNLGEADKLTDDAIFAVTTYHDVKDMMKIYDAFKKVKSVKDLKDFKINNIKSVTELLVGYSFKTDEAAVSSLKIAMYYLSASMYSRQIRSIYLQAVDGMDGADEARNIQLLYFLDSSRYHFLSEAVSEQIAALSLQRDQSLLGWVWSRTTNKIDSAISAAQGSQEYYQAEAERSVARFAEKNTQIDNVCEKTKILLNKE